MLAHGKFNSDFLNLKQFFVILVVTGILGGGTPKLEGMKKYETIHTFNRFQFISMVFLLSLDPPDVNKNMKNSTKMARIICAGYPFGAAQSWKINQTSKRCRCFFVFFWRHKFDVFEHRRLMVPLFVTFRLFI